MAKPEFETMASSPGSGDRITTTPWVPAGQYCVLVVLGQEEDGQIPVTVPRLPGVVSQGADEAEALVNIREALAGAIEEYMASVGEIPWTEEEPGAPPERARWVWIDAR
jgi:predicted RNase H-like HicB family nuclease